MPAAAPLDFLPPRLDQRVLNLARLLLPSWLRYGAGISAVHVRHGERLVAAMQAFQTGEQRLLLAFRHPSTSDPLCLAALLWRELPRLSRSLGVRLRQAPHSFFLYDRGIPLWAGPQVGWLLQRLGGSSIQRGRLDTAGLRSARELLLHGRYPFAAAPEGGTNGHNEVISPLEPGIAQLAFWTAEDLRKAGRPEGVTVLPIGIQYSWREPIWTALERLLSQLEEDAGLTPPAQRSLQPEPLYGRLLALAEQTLTLLERFYEQAYQRRLSEQLAMGERLQRLLTTALDVVETSLGVKASGDLTDRCRRLEQAAWERLYPHISQDSSPCRLQRGLADRLAEETERQLWHMRLVENFVAVSGHYVRELPSQERFADTLLLLWETHTKLLGRNPARRPRLGRRRVLISIGAPIAMDEHLALYQQDRRKAVGQLTADLQDRLQELIVPSTDLKVA